MGLSDTMADFHVAFQGLVQQTADDAELFREEGPEFEDHNEIIDAIKLLATKITSEEGGVDHEAIAQFFELSHAVQVAFDTYPGTPDEQDRYARMGAIASKVLGPKGSEE